MDYSLFLKFSNKSEISNIIELEESNIYKVLDSIIVLSENEIVLESIDFSKIKEFIINKCKDFIAFLGKLKDIIWNFLKEQIYKPIIEVKDSFLLRLKEIKEKFDKNKNDNVEIVTDATIEQYNENVERLNQFDIEIKNSTIEMLNKIVADINGSLDNIDYENIPDDLKNDILDTLEESITFGNCVVLYPKNEGAIDRLIHYFNSLNHAYSIFDNIIKYGKENIVLTSGSIEDEEKGFKNLNTDTKKCLSIISDIASGIKHDREALIFNVEKKKASVTDILDVSTYEKIFDFVETNSKKLITLRSEIDKSIQMLTKSMNEAERILSLFKERGLKQGSRLYKSIVTVIDKSFKTANILKNLTIANMKYLSVAGKISLKNIKLLTKNVA